MDLLSAIAIEKKLTQFFKKTNLKGSLSYAFVFFSFYSLYITVTSENTDELLNYLHMAV